MEDNLSEFRVKPLKLTPRERSVADLLALGSEPSRIAKELFLVPAYVYELIRRIKGKYSADNTYHLVTLLAVEKYKRRKKLTDQRTL